MEKMEYKKVWNFFLISQAEEEERWLNEMARNGWNFVRVNMMCRYVFKKGTPGEFIYKLDLPENMPHGLGKEEYYNFLTECGIRIVFELKDWMYLQKRAADGPFSSAEDMFSKLKMANKSYNYAVKTLSMLLKGFTAVMALSLLCQAIFSNPNIVDFFRGVTMGICIGSLFAFTLIWVPVLTKIRKKMNALVDEIAIKH